VWLSAPTSNHLIPRPLCSFQLSTDGDDTDTFFVCCEDDLFVYYESIKWGLQRRLIYWYRWDERLKNQKWGIYTPLRHWVDLLRLFIMNHSDSSEIKLKKMKKKTHVNHENTLLGVLPPRRFGLAHRRQIIRLTRIKARRWRWERKLSPVNWHRAFERLLWASLWKVALGEPLMTSVDAVFATPVSPFHFIWCRQLPARGVTSNSSVVHSCVFFNRRRTCLVSPSGAPPLKLPFTCVNRIYGGIRRLLSGCAATTKIEDS
jgi:hypothetical protein